MISYINIISKHNKIKKNKCCHNRNKLNCRDCKVIEICIHNNFRSYCKICKLYITKNCQLYKMKISNLINI